MSSDRKPHAEAVQSSAAQVAGLSNAALLTKKQAAEYLQATPRYLERMVRSGRLRAFKPSGKLWRVRRSELDSFLESGSTIGGNR